MIAGTFQHTQQQQSEGSASEHVVHMRMQQMLQIAAPAKVLRLLQSQATTVADAKTMKDVQNNVRLVAQELEAKTERLASCLAGITGDLETTIRGVVSCSRQSSWRLGCCG